MNDPAERLKDEFSDLRKCNRLSVSLDIPGAAAPTEVVADLSRRSIEVGMTLRAPEDKKSSKARVNWLIRQVKSSQIDNLYVRLNWPGRSETTQFAFADIIADPSIVEKDKPGLQVLSFHLYFAKRVGTRFTQQSNFIAELEEIVPKFYRKIGQNLDAWRKKPPRIKVNKDTAEDVSLEVMSENSDNLTN